MLPQAWRRRFERRHDTLLLSPGHDEVQISRRDNGRLEELDRIDMTLPDAAERMAATLGALKVESTRVEVAVPRPRIRSEGLVRPLPDSSQFRVALDESVDSPDH